MVGPVGRKKKRIYGRPYVKGDPRMRMAGNVSTALDELPLLCRSSGIESEPMPEEGKALVVTCRLRPSKNSRKTLNESKDVLGEFYHLGDILSFIFFFMYSNYLKLLIYEFYRWCLRKRGRMGVHLLRVTTLAV